MVRAFVTGGTGLIGRNVAIGLAAAGHEVYALVRNAQKAKQLEEFEVHVLEGDLRSVDKHKDIIATSGIIVHTAFDPTDYPGSDDFIVDYVLNFKFPSAQKPKFIYTSGVLVLPDSGSSKTPYDEYTAVESPIFGSRILNEKRIVASTNVAGSVIRPGFVYGRGSPQFVQYFGQGQKGSVTVDGPLHAEWAQIHIDDLVDAYVRVAEAPNGVVGGEIFNITNDVTSSNYEIAKAFSAFVGYTGEIKNNPSGGWAPAHKSVQSDASKARRYLNWVPRHPSLLGSIPTLFVSWKAFSEKKQ